jgi:tricorn protease
VTSLTAYDYSPSFDTERRFLDFLSRRALNPSMDPVQFIYSFAKPSKPYLVALRRGDPSPFLTYKKAGGPATSTWRRSSCGWSPSP